MARPRSVAARAVAAAVLLLPATARAQATPPAQPSGPSALPPAAAPAPHPDMPPPPPLRAVRVAFNDSLKGPESVKYDADQDVYLVSNVDGPSLAKDNNGFIARLRGDGTTERLRFIAGGANGVTLHAPKGMALVGDTLWVADIDAVRGFHRRTGAPVGTVDFAGQRAYFLNDIAVGPDGALYVTDTSIRYDARGLAVHPAPDRIFRVAPDRAVSVALQSDALGRPNGIAYDAANTRFLVVPQGGDTVRAWRPGTSALQPVATGPGQFDGVAVLDGGRVLVSSWATSSVHLVQDGRLVEVIPRVSSAADIDYDPRRRRVAVPLLGHDRVEWYELR